MAYDSAADLAQIQKDVLTTDVSGNTLINKANQLKTDAKRITKAINELKSQLDRSLEKGDTDRYCSVGNNRTANGFVLLKVSE